MDSLQFGMVLAILLFVAANNYYGHARHTEILAACQAGDATEETP